MVLGELIVVAVVVWGFAHAARRGRHFDLAWIAFFAGLAMMLSHRLFSLGAVLTGVSLGFLTLPMARAEWRRIQGAMPNVRAESAPSRGKASDS